MKATVEISNEAIGSLLVGAFEGGSNYWYEITAQQKPDGPAALWLFRLDQRRVFPHVDYPMNEGGWLKIQSLEEPEKGEFKLDRKVIEKGLQLLASSKEYAHHFSDILKEDDDAITADVFLQFCLFGDVVYS
jgi:hypothetical protein